MIVLALLALMHPARALDLKWWGVGPDIGTMAIPGQYPTALPTVAQGQVDKVKGDVEVGLHGVVYPTASERLFALATLGFGTSAWGQQELTLGWDQALIKDQEFQLLFGAGIGAGHERFKDKGAEDYLNTNYFPLRAQITASLRDRVRAYSVDLYGTYHIVGGQQRAVAIDLADGHRQTQEGAAGCQRQRCHDLDADVDLCARWQRRDGKDVQATQRLFVQNGELAFLKGLFVSFACLLFGLRPSHQNSLTDGGAEPCDS